MIDPNKIRAMDGFAFCRLLDSESDVGMVNSEFAEYAEVVHVGLTYDQRRPPFKAGDLIIATRYSGKRVEGTDGMMYIFIPITEVVAIYNA